MANTALYAGVGAAVVHAGLRDGRATRWPSTRSRGKQVVFNVILAGVLVPGVILAIPQYLLLAKVGLTNTYWSVLLPSMISPYGIYLARIFAAAAVPDRGAGGRRASTAPATGATFARIALPMMRAGLVTVFLFQFVAIWNNFMLPYIMLGDDRLFPVTVGPQRAAQPGRQPARACTPRWSPARCCRSSRWSPCSSACSATGRSTWRAGAVKA